MVVRLRAPGSTATEALIRQLGGGVTRRLPIVGGFAARLPAGTVRQLARSPGVADVWLDRPLRPGHDRPSGKGGHIPLSEYDGLAPNRIWQQALGIPQVRAKYDGTGVTVALLDTGVTRVPDLEEATRLRLDFTPGQDGIDRFGHGSHMAGIIAGDGAASVGKWAGVAPGAKLVSVKVAGPDGATDVSLILAAIQWIVSHKDQYGIRVLNLSYDTDSTQTYGADPLDYAVERAWQAGIVVVVSAGNDGLDQPDIGKPGDDPFVVTVGAADLGRRVGTSDDAVAPFSSRGPTQDWVAKPDLVAPGVSIVSVRAASSTADILRPRARLAGPYTKGTGTSQAAAVVSGIVAMMIDANPGLTPDQVKAALIASAGASLAGELGAGAGLVDAQRAVRFATDPKFLRGVRHQPYVASTGLGSIDASRGTQHAHTAFDSDSTPDLVTGEIDALGAPWDPFGWSGHAWSAATWASSPWNPLVAVGEGWDPAPPPGGTWSGLVWAAEAWLDKEWDDSGWVSKAWSSKAWSTWN